MAASSIMKKPDVRAVVAPVLASLPAATISTQPAPTVLPLLSPILRQRVQLLASSSTEGWIRLLSYHTADIPKLVDIAQKGELEPHPVSGEIEVDWDCDAHVTFRRFDRETLQALVVISRFDLFFRLIYCTGDKDGGGDGWKIGEVGVASSPSVVPSFQGSDSIDEAERKSQSQSSASGSLTRQPNLYDAEANEEEEDDDDGDYWARYDATPARTPAIKRSPAPRSLQARNTISPAQPSPYRSTSAEDDYFARYDVSRTTDMDDQDPNPFVRQNGLVPGVAPPLGLAYPAASHESPEQAEINETSGVWTLADPPPRSPSEHSSHHPEDTERAAAMIHPRPDSARSGSSGAVSVAKLEEAAEKQDHGEFGIKQHVSRSIRSLFLLSRTAGIDRHEFERMVRTELDVLGMMEDEI